MEWYGKSWNGMDNGKGEQIGLHGTVFEIMEWYGKSGNGMGNDGMV